MPDPSADQRPSRPILILGALFAAAATAVCAAAVYAFFLGASEVGELSVEAVEQSPADPDAARLEAELEQLLGPEMAREVLAAGGAQEATIQALLQQLAATDAPPAQPPDDAQRTDSGLAWQVVRPGAGERRPGPGDRVTAHYLVWSAEGQLVENSIASGEAAELELSQLAPGWSEGLQQMVEGEEARIWLPEALSGGEALVIDVELIAIE